MVEEIPKQKNKDDESSQNTKKTVVDFFKQKKIALLVAIFSFFCICYIVLMPYINLARENNISLGFLYTVIKNNPEELKTYSGRTNVLLLGISGGKHDGSTLSDSIIVLSLDGKKKNAVILSLPRDIWSETLKDKINSAYAYGEAKQKGGGILLSKAITEEIIGQPIHYAFVIDFEGFENLIDSIGGIDFVVDKGFIDKLFPIEGKENDLCKGDPNLSCRYQTIEFKAGLQHMNGEKALQYVRSRNAEGDEGNDISRGKRQQQVLFAVKDKIVNIENILNLEKLKSLTSKFNKVIETDMSPSELILFARVFSSLGKNDIKHPILSMEDPVEGKKGFLSNPPVYQFDGKWVLIPRQGNGEFQEIHEYIECFVEKSNCKITP